MTEEERQAEAEQQVQEQLQAEEDISEDLIAQANAAAIRIEKANEETTRLLMKAEQMKVSQTFRGRAEAGTPAKSQEDKEKEDARKYLEGTGIDPFEE